MSTILPGAFSPWFARVFGKRIVRPMFRKKFEAVRIARGSADRLRACADHDGALLIAMNHVGWWDPLVALMLARACLPDRTSCGPIDRDVLESMGILKKLGLFGVDPDDPEQLEEFVNHAASLLADSDRSTFWITPQGAFADVRDKLVLRPGLSAVSSECVRQLGASRVRAVAVAVEYAFWESQKPGVFLRVSEVAAEDPGATTSWQRAWTRAMRDNGAALSELVISRNPDAFEDLVAPGRPAGSHPVYDLFRSITGAGEAPIRNRSSRAPESAPAHPTKGSP